MTQQFIRINEEQPMDERRCSNPAPHAAHEWRMPVMTPAPDALPVLSFGDEFLCPGRRAHANVMIGRE